MAVGMDVNGAVVRAAISPSAHIVTLPKVLISYAPGSQELRPTLKSASLAILGTAAILASALAGPAMAKGAKNHQAKCVGSNCQIKGSGTLAKDQRHMQRHAAYRGERFRNTNAALTSERSVQWNRGAAAPGVVAGNVFG